MCEWNNDSRISYGHVCRALASKPRIVKITEGNPAPVMEADLSDGFDFSEVNGHVITGLLVLKSR
jgi:hypothetical protein